MARPRGRVLPGSWNAKRSPSTPAADAPAASVARCCRWGGHEREVEAFDGIARIGKRFLMGVQQCLVDMTQVHHGALTSPGSPDTNANPRRREHEGDPGSPDHLVRVLLGAVVSAHDRQQAALAQQPPAHLVRGPVRTRGQREAAAAGRPRPPVDPGRFSRRGDGDPAPLWHFWVEEVETCTIVGMTGMVLPHAGPAIPVGRTQNLMRGRLARPALGFTVAGLVLGVAMASPASAAITVTLPSPGGSEAGHRW